ncbi:MAG TPA: hypothetical protein DCO79_02805 [Spirochaeta sp.]|nr:hypothetical protein [Spirochaeta sp.]
MPLTELEDLPVNTEPEAEQLMEISDEGLEDIEAVEDDDDISDGFMRDIEEDDVSWEPDFELLGKNIASLTSGLELPSGIFSLAVNFFKIKSGIFLTFESDSGYFTPFSSLSIDETTLRRCRINIDVLKEHNLIFSGTTIHPSVSKDFLKDYISKRLWDTIDNLDMFIFSHHDKIFGLLIMFNLKISTNMQYIDFASFFTRKCSEKFFNSRAKIISRLPALPVSAPVTPKHAADIITEYFNQNDKEKTESVKFVYVNYNSIINSLLEKDDSIDRHRIEDDIYKMYNSMLFEDSFIIKFRNGSLLLCFADGLNNDNSIVQHQMEASLISLFEKNSMLLSPIVRVMDWDLKKENLDKEIADFIASDL